MAREIKIKVQNKIAGAGCIAILFLFASIIWLLFSRSSPICQASALSTTRMWARLAPYPESAEEKHIEILGSPLDVMPTNNPDGSRHYKINPGGGAAFAEHILESNGNAVHIHTYWN